MTDQDYRHYIIIVDRSGSMNKIREDAQGGIREFAAEQAKLPGKATLSLYQFDNEHETVHKFASLSKVAGYVLVPRNTTALLDAIGFAITREGEHLAAMPEGKRPGKVVALIATDGHENASKEYSLGQVKELTTRQQNDYGWAFTYIGANQDAFSVAESMGISKAATLDYARSGVGTQSAYGAASAAASRYVRGPGGQSLSYTDDEREDAKKED